MKIALTQACLKVKCYYSFSIVADNIILATDTTKTKFWRKFFGRLFSKRCGTVAVLRSCSELKCGEDYSLHNCIALAIGVYAVFRECCLQSAVLSGKRCIEVDEFAVVMS